MGVLQGVEHSWADSWYLLQSVLLRPVFPWCVSFLSRRWCLEAFSLMLILWTGRVCHGGILGLWYWAICMNKAAAEVFTSLSSCKEMFQQITSVGQWSLGWMCGCPSCGPWDTEQLVPLNGAQVSVSLLLCLQELWPCSSCHLAWALYSECHQTGLNHQQYLYPPLSTLDDHTKNLEGFSSADFHHFSTERMCSPILNWCSIAHCISLVPFHTVLFSHFSWLHFLQSLNQTNQGKGDPEITPEDPMKHKLVFIRTLFFLTLFVFPTKQRAVTYLAPVCMLTQGSTFVYCYMGLFW